MTASGARERGGAAPAAAIELGPFVLEAPLGRGGMGEVWRAVHAASGLPVAVKVVTAARARESGCLEALRREVQAVAALDHPNIVAVYDQGEVSARAAADSGGRLVAGSPFLAMELADGVLDRAAPPRDFAALRALLAALLAALGHAHARGLVHRDVKPSNVLLLAPHGAAAPLAKLGDFGLARAFDELHPRGADVGGGARGGTLGYMAPEQVRGAWRDFGPWTDLYALGCLAYELASGRTPFAGTDDVAAAHLGLAPPPLRARLAVPAGFEPWLHRLLAKDPRARPHCAAAAARALRALPDAALPAEASPASPVATASPHAAPAARGAADEATLHTLTRSDALPADEHCEPVVLASGVVPAAARGADDDDAAAASLIDEAADEAVVTASLPPPPPAPAGTGLGLFGLRAVPLAGRRGERAALWSALRAVRTRGAAQFVLLHDAAGTGKSRLAAWLCERAHETAGAWVFRGACGPERAREIEAMCARGLRCGGLTPVALRARLAYLLDEEPGGARVRTLAAALAAPEDASSPSSPSSPATTTQPPAGASASLAPAQRYAAVCWMLARLARGRPVVVWLDDVHASLDALDFVEYLLRAQARGEAVPVLVVATARDDDAAASDPLVALQLARLCALPGAARVRVPPLDAAQHAALVRNILGLRGELAAEVAERTAGNPLFAVQLVRDWVERRVLVPAASGLALRPGADARVPDGVHALWSARCARFCEAAPCGAEGARAALELAAALGRVVDPREWAAACERAGFAAVATPALLDALVRGGLARRDAGDASDDAGGWSLVHGMLRESLLRAAADAGRLAAHHRHCAAALAGRRGTAARAARHLLAAGELADALAPLDEAFRDAIVATDYRAAEALLAERDRAAQTLALGESDARVVRGRIARAWLAQRVGRIDAADEAARAARAVAERQGWQGAVAEATRQLAVVARKRGDFASAAALARRAIALGEAAAVGPEELALAWSALAGTLVTAGDARGADAAYERAGELARGCGLDATAGYATLGRAAAATIAGELDRAAALFERALVELDAVPVGLADAYVSLGDLHARRGALDAAEDAYRRGIALQQSFGSSGEVVRCNLALLALQRGRYAEAAAEFATFGPRSRVRRWIDAGQLCCAAAARDWDAYDGWLAALLAAQARGRIEAHDIALPVERAGALALAAGQGARAAPALREARALWRACGDAAAAARIDALLARVGDGGG